MRLRNTAKGAAVAMALLFSLAACGGGADDGSRPGDEFDRRPDAPGGPLDSKNDGEARPDDPAPNQNPIIFDYSEIGVTDKLGSLKQGFGFYHKGPESPLDRTRFESAPTLSPAMAWSSALKLDKDLQNFVAVGAMSPGNSEGAQKPRFMFDGIGLRNQENNVNFVFFGGMPHNAINRYPGRSSLDEGSKKNSKPADYAWNLVPAVVNTFMWRNSKNEWAYAKSEDEAGFPNQEEVASDKFQWGSGQVDTRIYGRNAFLERSDVASPVLSRVMDPQALDRGSAKTATYKLENRQGNYLEHVNFLWYDLGSWSKRKQKAEAFILEDKLSVNLVSALQKYLLDDETEPKTRPPFPTDVQEGVLKRVQFGRLTGRGADVDDQDAESYGVPGLKIYPFTPGEAAATGDKKAEDWYFARGVEPTPVAKMDALGARGGSIGYDGLAVMFGIDYKPTGPVKKEANGTGQSTNSVKPPEKTYLAKTPLDGKQNFVRMEWNPATGEIKGRIYGVWTLATYWRDPDLHKLIKLPTVTKQTLTTEEYARTLKRKYTTEPLIPSDSLKLETDVEALEIAKHALVLEPWAVSLVEMKGEVEKGGNAFKGVAVRVKDKSPGMFMGGFFGPGAEEIVGVVDSQTGDMRDKDLKDPADIWGGAFGAQRHDAPIDEDLKFHEAVVDYGTSTEFFTE